MSPIHHFGLSDHASWAYTDDAERAATAARWLADGLALGQRAVYVADAPAELLMADLADISGRDEAVAAGALVVAQTGDMYDLAAPIDAAAQLAVYSAAVEHALSDGFTGIRVAVDITPLIEDPQRRTAHLRWEQAADRYLTDAPLAPLCLYDGRKITGFPAIDHVHPLTGPHPVPFSLYAIGPARSALAGEIDAMSAAPLVEILASLPTGDDTIDAAQLQFLDAYAGRLLAQTLERRQPDARALALQDPSALVRRLWDLCDFNPALLSN